MISLSFKVHIQQFAKPTKTVIDGSIHQLIHQPKDWQIDKLRIKSLVSLKTKSIITTVYVDMLDPAQTLVHSG